MCTEMTGVEYVQLSGGCVIIRTEMTGVECVQ